jgi:DNA polymerase III epsilon subunit-like protein
MNNLVLDTETESLSLGLSRPWQLAFIFEENGKIKKSVNHHIDIHDLNVGKDAARITGFNIDKYNQIKIPANDVIDDIEPYLMNENNRLIGHNILGFDIFMLATLYKYAGRKLDFKKIVYRFYDTLCIARAQHYESPPPKDKYEWLAWQYKHLAKFDKSFKGSLAACCKRNDIEVDETKTHNALYDIELNLKLFNKLKYALDLN